MQFLELLDPDNCRAANPHELFRVEPAFDTIYRFAQQKFFAFGVNLVVVAVHGNPFDFLDIQETHTLVFPNSYAFQITFGCGDGLNKVNKKEIWCGSALAPSSSTSKIAFITWIHEIQSRTTE